MAASRGHFPRRRGFSVIFSKSSVFCSLKTNTASAAAAASNQAQRSADCILARHLRLINMPHARGSSEYFRIDAWSRADFDVTEAFFAVRTLSQIGGTPKEAENVY